MPKARVARIADRPVSMINWLGSRVEVKAKCGACKRTPNPISPARFTP